MFAGGRRIFPILHGVSPEEAKRELPPISEALMRKWADFRSPTPIIRRDSRRGQAGRGAGAGGSGDGGARPDWEELLAQSSRGSIDGIAKTILGSTIERRGESAKVVRLLEESGRAVVIGRQGIRKERPAVPGVRKPARSRSVAFVKADDILGIGSFDELTGP